MFDVIFVRLMQRLSMVCRKYQLQTTPSSGLGLA